MARKLELTWHKPTKRWRKRYKGRDYYFPYGESKSNRTGYEKALAAWKERRAKIGADKPHRDDYERAMKRWTQMADWYWQNGDREGYERTKAQCSRLRTIFEESDSPPALDHFERDPLYGISEAGRAIWAERLGQAQIAGSGPGDQTVAGVVTSFLKRKQTQAEVGERSHGRFDSLRCCLEHFRDWVGGHQHMDVVTSRTLLDYHSALIEAIGAGRVAKYYARDRMQAAKQFVRWCWELELLPLPRNIDSKELTIKLPANPIQTFTVEEVRRLVDNATDTLKLYLLLMLNCGMQQQDIARLRQPQVDWKTGRISVKRSKTQEHANVPKVQYKLWPETFTLLKKHRSAEGDLVLVNAKGGPLKFETIVDGKVKKTDNIRSAYERLLRKLKIKGKDRKPLKLIRKTSSSKLAEHRDYGRFAQYFLGQAPATVADKHYVRPSQELFDEAVGWLHDALLK